jgi:HAD superfamily hydrolase (TIGR01484 family)
MHNLPLQTILSNIRLIATDMDGTLTQNGQFSYQLLRVLEQFQAADLPVLIVTGRSAGWVSGLVHYLPIVGAIAENGGIFCSKAGNYPVFLQTIEDVSRHRQQLQTQFERLRQVFPDLQETPDNRFRLTDWTFDVAGLSSANLKQMADSCKDNGLGFTYSTVQCHIKLLGQDKATGLAQVLHQQFPQLTREQILTVGDSPNDESLFDARQFPHSVGVANVRHYLERLEHKPAWITQAEAGAGFCELADKLLFGTG